MAFIRLACKLGIDDMRESGAIMTVETLLEERVKVRAYEPVTAESYKELFRQLQCAKPEAILKCEAALIVTVWK